MMHFWIVRWLLLYILFELLHFKYTEAIWSGSNVSDKQLIGLFPDPPNASQSEITTFTVHARAMFKAAVTLSQQYNITINEQLIGWQSAETGGSIIGSLSSTCQAVSTSNIIGVVGPSLSRETPTICAVTNTIGIPTISYGATSPGLSDKAAYPSFYRTVPSDSAAALAIAKLFLKYNWTSCVVIFQNDEYGTGGADVLNEAFDKNNITVIETLLFDIYTRKFRGNLKDTLISSSTRIVIAWVDLVYLPTVIQYGLDNDVIGPHFQWILGATIPLNTFNPLYYSKLVGMITIEPTVANKINALVNTTLLNAAYDIWQKYEPETFPGRTQIDNYAYFAFDATWLLIQSLSKLCSSSSNTSSSCLSFTNSTSCYDRHFLNTNLFFNTISSTNFLGVSGPVQFNNKTADRIGGIYYTGQNVQSSENRLNYVSVLQWTESSDWQPAIGSNVIVWPGNSLKPPNGLPGLNGVTLQISVIPATPFTIITEIIDASGKSVPKLTGYIPDLLNRLEKELGFTANITVLSADGAYNDYVKQIADGVYDMFAADVTITSSRRKIVDFSTAIFDNSLRIILREGTAVGVDLLSFMRPFSIYLWLLILAALLYASVLICLLERRQNLALKQKSIISSIAMSVWFSFGTLVGYGADFHVHTAAGRLLTVGLYILSIILVATYTANLASDLTIAKTENIITGLNDIKSGKISYSRIGILVESAIEDFYLREISGGSRNYYPLSGDADMYGSLINQTIDAAIMDTGALEYATNMIYCNLTLVGSDFDPSAYGIVIRKQWIYAQTLDVNILSLKEAGFLDELKRKWFDGKVCGDSSGDTSTGITIETVAGLFLTFAVISILAILLFLWLKRRIVIRRLCKILRHKRWGRRKNGSIKTTLYEMSSTSLNSFRSDSESISTIRL